MTGPANDTLSPRKTRIRDLAEQLAHGRAAWIAKNAYYHERDWGYMRFLVPAGSRVLDLGCGTGRLLAELAPSRGVGIDFSEAMIETAREACPELEFHVGDIEDSAVLAEIEGPFDAVILADTVGSLDDVETLLKNLQPLTSPETRIIVCYYSQVWNPLLRLAERLGGKMPQEPQNWLSSEDIEGLLTLAGFECIKRDWRLLLPRFLFGLGPLVNNTLGTLPMIRRACLRNYLVARSTENQRAENLSTTVVIPCRNERGNIEPAVARLPAFCDDIEILFIEGHSKDGTLDEIRRVIAAYPERDIKVLVQDGRGKADAVHKGFAAARGDVLMILDADLTVPPEDLPKFYDALASGKGEFINGTRLVYPMETGAMRALNTLGNRYFAHLFTWLLNQRFTDTLCGTKVLTRESYAKIAANRAYFGDFDPFGDFDLIFGAVKLNLKVIEVPIRYADRTYGSTQISRFRHGWLLLRMCVFAFFKLKAF
jgi:SAM-dependent methyltransferase